MNRLVIRVLGLSATAAIAWMLASLQPGALARTAWYLGMLCLAGVLTFPPSRRRRHQWNGNIDTIRIPAWIARHVALYLGVSCGIILVILLVMRLVYFAIDLIHGYPWQGARNFGFGAASLLTVASLCIASVLSLVRSRDGRFATIQFWLLMLLTMWASQLSPAFRTTQTGGYMRTDAALILVECASYLIPISVLLVGWLLDCGFLRMESSTAESGMTVSQGVNFPAGFRTSVAVVSLGLNIAILYQILVPVGGTHVDFRTTGFRTGSAALIAAIGGIALLRRSWSAQLADAVLGLFALSICGFASLAVPISGSPLAQQYPMLFNALIVGYAFAAALFTQWSIAWGELPSSGGEIRTRFVPHLKRFAFLAGATSLLAGVMMCFWPGMPGIFAMDHSLGRVLAGVSAFLFLLFVSLRAARLMARASFHILTLAVAASMVAFLLVRALPFMSEQPHG